MEIGATVAFKSGRRLIMGIVTEIGERHITVDARTSDKMRGFKLGKYLVLPEYLTVF